MAMKWRLDDEELVGEADALLSHYLSRQLVLSAPHFIRYELANSLEQARRRRRLNAEGVTQALQFLLDLGVHAPADSDDVLGRAACIARELDLSVYDALYVAHAEHERLPLVTNDAGLLRRVSAHGFAAHHLADVASLL